MYKFKLFPQKLMKFNRNSIKLRLIKIILQDPLVEFKNVKWDMPLIL